MPSAEAKARLQEDPARFIVEEIKAFAGSSPLNRMPFRQDDIIFDEPLVRFADGDDPLFAEYKTIIAPTHLTPRQALARGSGKGPQDMPAPLSVISWILPVAAKTRRSNRRQTRIPSRLWSYTRWYGEKFNDALRRHLVEILIGMDYLAVAPMLAPYFKIASNKKGAYSNWSERHIAYAAGHGTFSLSDGFITERGIAHRCGSVVTSVALPVTSRTAQDPYSNCLFYVDASCKACIARCPAGAITEDGHDKMKCQIYHHDEIRYLRQEYEVGVAGCGLCQVRVPCESANPTRKPKRKAAE